MPFLDRQAWLYSLKTFLAAAAALYVAMASGQERPYWAMMTVYIVSQPLVGPTRAKGLYRILGTFIGGVATLIMLPNLVHAPVLLSAAMALWLSLALYIALLHRGPNGYMFMLAGYTAALLGFPAVESPQTIFDSVVARSEEIMLGAGMAIAFAAILLPASVRPTLNGRIGSWMQDAARWYHGIRHGQPQQVPLSKLSADLVQLESLIAMMRHEGHRHTGIAGALEKLRERMLLLLPVLSSLSDRLVRLQADGSLPAALGCLLDDIGAWLQQHEGADEAAASALRARVAALRPAGTSEHDLLLASLLLRLDELIGLWLDCASLREVAIHAPGAVPRRHSRFPSLRLGQERHVDHGMAAMAALSTGASLFAYCLVWIAVGWEAGGNGAMMAAIASAFFASQDDPAPAIFGFGLWLAVAAVIGAVCLFGVFPAIHEFGTLVACLALIFLPLGVMMYGPRTMQIGLPLTVNLAALLSVQNSREYDIVSFVNNAVAMVIGIGFAVVFTKVFRSVSVEWSARRLARRAWGMLAEVAAGSGGPADKQQLIARILDLLGVLAPRIARASRGNGIEGIDMLADTRVGLNLLQLRRVRPRLQPAVLAGLDEILADVAAHYRRQSAAGTPEAGSEALRQRLDTAIARESKDAETRRNDDYLHSLVGLRMSLFRHQAA
ncbi:multidrug efflux protein [Bordetella ansorpii]|uniref:Multidrug efflux protein n=1 Tax=Bordetella ansorpii TaxID=288768 RepID=A0A157QLG2_9BORD|nr:FUSC family protein [Bordetella ansorpii]SAI46366.1 multidrug efflux protein [Bordetella ansorpii]